LNESKIFVAVVNMEPLGDDLCAGGGGGEEGESGPNNNHEEGERTREEVRNAGDFSSALLARHYEYEARTVIDGH
jgi:hypothetical protein